MRKIQVLATLLVLVALVMASCTPAATPTPKPAEPTAKPAQPTQPPAAAPTAIQAKEATSTPVPTVAASKYKEAPMLADLVKAGKLPAVDKRLPDNPMVIKPVDKIGKYGGTMNLVSGDAGGIGNIKMKMYDPPIRWKADLTGYEPGLAEKYEWSADGKVFTLTFRKNLKWSDGTPFTMKDMQFWWEDLAVNADYKVITIPWYLYKSDAKTPVDVTFPNDYTMVWTSDQAMWVTPYIMAQGFWEWEPLMKPMHYLKQFHPKYTPTAKFDDLEKKDKWWENPDYPVLNAWRCLKKAEDGTRITFERNPYYWKVDTEGNQLPYIDTVVVEIVKDNQVAILQASQGKYDVVFRGAGATPNDIPFLTEQAKTGGYHLMKNWWNGAGAWPGFLINQYYVEGGKNYVNDTPEMAKEIREVLRDKRFRKGMSVAIDRKRMIEVVWGGIGTPQGATISPQSWHFASAEGQKIFKEWQQADATFDAAKAAKYFDDMGMKKGADGWRTLPSGKPFTLIVDVTDWATKKISEDSSAELKIQFEKVGLKTELKNVIGQPDSDTRQTNGFYMLRGTHVSEVDIWTYPDWIFPLRDNRAFPLEGKYRQSGGKEGVKPAEGSPAAKLQALYDKGMTTASIEDRHKVVYEAVKLIIEEGPFVLGIAGDQQVPVLVKDYMMNVLDFGVTGPWAPGTPGNQHSAQWWINK